MKKHKSPLGWFFEPKDGQDIIGYYIGDSSSALAGKVIKNISYPESFTWSSTFDAFESFSPWNWSEGIGWGKKTLHVTKKEDIKFV